VFTLISILAYKVISPYLSLIIITFIIVLIFKPIYRIILKSVNGREGIATNITVLLILLTFILPSAFLVFITIQQTKTFYDDITQITEDKEGNSYTYNDLMYKVNNVVDKIPYVKYEINYDENKEIEVKYYVEKFPNANYLITKEKAKNVISNSITPATKFFFNKIIDIGYWFSDLIPKLVIFMFLLYALLPNHPKLIAYIKKLSPFDDDIDEMYIRRIVEMSQSMVKGSLIISIVQGIISGLILWVVGVKYVAFFSLLMVFLSIIPLGAGMVNIPIGVVLILLGNYWQGALVLINHFIVITNIDNLLRPKLVSKEADLPPVLTLMSVLGGIKFFGFMGFVYGPIIMIFFMTTLQVYLQNYKTEIS
jgi:predicted PurR-regulated permease PerM